MVSSSWQRGSGTLQQSLRMVLISLKSLKKLLEMFGAKENEQSTERSVSDEGTYEPLDGTLLDSESPGLEEEEMIEICEITGEIVKTPEGINQVDMEMDEIEVEVVSSQLSQAVQQEPCTQHSDKMKQLKLLFVTMIMLLVMCVQLCA